MTTTDTPVTPDRCWRIALVTGQLSRGGAEKQLVQLATGLDRQRFAAHVICLSEQLTPYGPLLQDAGVPVHPIPRSGSLELRRLRKLAALLTSLNIDLVHSFLDHATAYAVPAAHLAGRLPCLASVQNCAPPASWWRRMLLGRAHRHAERVLVNASAVGAWVQQLYGVAAGDILVLPNGVDLQQFYPAPADPALNKELGLPPEAPLVLSAGRLCLQKRFDVFLLAADRLARQHPDIHFAIAGQGPLADTLRQQRASLGLTDRVHLLGERSDMPRLLRRASLFVLTSDYEGQPNAVLEAAATGVPLVVTENCNCQELVSQGRCGAVVPGDDPAAVACAVEHWLAHPDQAQRAGERGRTFVEQHYPLTQLLEVAQLMYTGVLTPDEDEA